MPYSFTQIEKEKTFTIQFVFIFLIFFYFLTVYGIAYLAKVFFITELNGRGLYRIEPVSFNFSEMFIILVAALVLGVGHWAISTNNLVPKMIKTLGARPLDARDTYHQMFRNIVDEVSVATGGKPIEAVVVPTMAMNAFALADFEGTAVIGVTEGLLAKLNRAQVEAVVGHEAAHIVRGDCLSTTVSISLFALYNGMLNNLTRVLGHTNSSTVRSRGHGAILFLLVVYLVLLYTRFLSLLINMFISRQRELRADAVAVRLTRDPLSLAEALYTISYHWRGAHLSAEELEAIFVINPKFSRLDERDGPAADLFATHPPVEERLHVLLDLAKADAQILQDTFEAQEKRPRRSVPQPVIRHAGASSWMVFQDGQWLGPLSLPAVLALQWVKPDTWVKKEGGTDVVPAYADDEISRSLWKKAGNVRSSLECPRCHAAFAEVSYEGLPINQCIACGGILVNDDQIQRVIIRHEVGFSEDIMRTGKFIKEQERLHWTPKGNLKTPNLWECPVCPEPKPPMIRRFYNLAYPVEVDRCLYCNQTFFDKNELELLQYLIEENTNPKNKREQL